MQIEIRDDVAIYVQSKARQAGFESVEAYLLYLLDERETSRDDPVVLPYEQWREKYWEFVAHQKSRNPRFDDSSESK